MIALLIALAILFLTVVLLSVFRKKATDEVPSNVPDADCCGAHEVCDKDLENFLKPDNIYFDDEELDRFCKKNNPYNDEEVEVFREVLYTLKRSEISTWLSSLDFRKIPTPGVIRDEAMLLLQD